MSPFNFGIQMSNLQALSVYTTTNFPSCHYRLRSSKLRDSLMSISTSTESYLPQLALLPTSALDLSNFRDLAALQGSIGEVVPQTQQTSVSTTPETSHFHWQTHKPVESRPWCKIIDGPCTEGCETRPQAIHELHGIALNRQLEAWWGEESRHLPNDKNKNKSKYCWQPLKATVVICPALTCSNCVWF